MPVGRFRHRPAGANLRVDAHYERLAMKTTVLLAALAFATATPVLACDYHATHTTAADENATTVVCDGNGCHALQTSNAQQDRPAEPTVVAQTDK